jgi:hypothetical protein
MSLYWIWTSDHRLEVKKEKVERKNISFFATIKIHDVKLHICYKPQLEKLSVETGPKNPNYPVPYLKSNLQKAIRRKLTCSAICTTQQLLIQDPLALLRRLPVIAVEDVEWSEEINYVVWMMCAVSKGFVLQSHQHQHIYLLVSMLCSSNGRYIHYYRNRTFYSCSEIVTRLLRRIPSKCLGSLRRDSLELVSLVALLVRVSYGGMNGDMNLLHSLSYHLEKIPQGSYAGFGPFVPGEHQFSSCHQLPEAIDFHCSDITTKASKKFNINESMVRQFMWDYRSGVNVRDVQERSEIDSKKRSEIDSEETKESRKFPVWWEKLRVWLDEESKRLWKVSGICENDV